MAIRMYGGAAAAVFTALDSLSRAEQVERRLTDAIVLGLIPAEQQLPGEVELANLLGVSTVTVREALKSLRRLGLVETRRGRGGGSFVRLPEGPVGQVVRDRLRRLSTAQIRDIGDHYAALAGAAARLAALRATPGDVARLERAHAALEQAGTEGERRRAESHFHIDVAAVAQSPLLFREEIGTQAEVGPLLWLAVGEETHADNLRLTGEVVEAIAAADGDKARRLTEERVAVLTAQLVETRLRLLEEEV